MVQTLECRCELAPRVRLRILAIPSVMGSPRPRSGRNSLPPLVHARSGVVRAVRMAGFVVLARVADELDAVPRWSPINSAMPRWSVPAFYVASIPGTAISCCHRSGRWSGCIPRRSSTLAAWLDWSFGRGRHPRSSSTNASSVIAHRSRFHPSVVTDWLGEAAHGMRRTVAGVPRAGAFARVRGPRT